MPFLSSFDSICQKSTAAEEWMWHTSYTTRLHFKVSADGCLLEQTVKGCVAEMLGELHFRHHRKIPFVNRGFKFQNSIPNATRHGWLGWHSVPESVFKSNFDSKLISSMWNHVIWPQKGQKQWVLSTVHETGISWFKETRRGWRRSI